MGVGYFDLTGRSVVCSARLAVAIFVLLYASGVPLRAETASNAVPTEATSSHSSDPHFDIDAFDIDGNTLLGDTDVESAVYPFTGPDRGRDDVAGARDALLKAYSAKGYSSVVVEVPQQDVRKGIVRLHVVEIPLGRLRVVGAQYNLPSRIKEQVPSLVEGKVPNFTQAQAELAQVNRTSNVQVTPAEHNGKVPGTVDVDLHVKDTLPFTASATVNNDHAQNTTPLRTIASVSYGNLWQLGHQASLTAILAPENFSNAEVFVGSYSAPIPETPWSLQLSGTYSNSNVQALAGAGVFGKGFTTSLTGTMQLPSWDDIAQTFFAGIAFKHNVNDTLFPGFPATFCNRPNKSGRACSDYWPIDAGYTLTQQTADETLTASAQVTLGIRGLGGGVASFENNRAFARSNFTKLNLDATYLRNLPWDMRLSVTVSGQVSDQALLATEEFSAGGLSSLRGYLQSEALGDEGYFADFELLSPSLVPYISDWIGQNWIGHDVLDDWRFFIFSDNAAAWVLDSLPAQRSVFPLNSIGVGSQITLLSHLDGNVSMGMPMRNGVVTRAWHPDIQFSVSTEF